MLEHSPRAFPLGSDPPVGTHHVRENPVRRPEGADHARGFACAKGASGSITRGAGTSATVSSLSAGGRSAAGRRPDGRPGVAGMPRSEPSTPRQRRSVVNESNLYPSPLKTPKLRRRVVTQLKLFFPSLCDRPGCHEPPVISVRNLAHYCCSACRQAVQNVHDRERKWLSRNTPGGRKRRAIGYQTEKRRRCLKQRSISAPAPLRAPPE